MIKKLRYLHQLILETPSISRSSRVLAPALIILLYLGGMSDLHSQSSSETPFTESTEALSYDFNACASFSNDESFKDYSEFTAVAGNSCAAISGGQIYRVTGNHSCTSDEHGTAGDAACFQSSLNDYYTADHDLAIRFDIELSGGNGKASRLDGISFKQLAPHQYLWNNTGLTGSTGPNNYPTKFGIRVSKDGNEIMVLSDLGTTQSWYTSEFNFNHNEHFVVAAGASSTFTFELYSYAPIGNGASVSAWDLDDLKIFSSCEEECNLTVDAGEDQKSCAAEEYVLTANASNESVCTEIISSYKITDSNTEAGCFTADPGVIFQKGSGCQGIDYVWSAGDDLVLNEYADNTASITGSVIDQNGRVATVDMKLSDKENSGTTWNASCYLDGISGPETYYRSFMGAITVDGVAQSVGTRFNAHYILADGAGFDSSQFGLGAWTGGAFGECTEWFANLIPMEIENSTQEIEYLWSTGETTKSITVTEAGEYTVTVSDCEGCIVTDTVKVMIEDKVVIGDYVWLDENRNGIQDDGETGINDVKVTLYQCNGDEVGSTTTADNAEGESGAYSFEVCPNSGEYYVVFGDIPDGMEFTDSNSGGDDSLDSDANENGRTDCFEIMDEDDLTIDGGLIEICNIKIDAGEEVGICSGETIEITAQLIENTDECPSVCVYPIKDQERCSGALGNYEIFLMSTTGNIVDAKFKASEQKFERYADNSARYTATASNGMDEIKIDALFTGYTTSTPVGSPKTNNCQEFDTSDWEYWTTWEGTVTSENHGVFNLSVKGASFQMGVGADVMRTGFGASGWFYADGGDGFYVSGDVNVTVDPCVENGITYKWTTEDGNIVGNANQKTIEVNEPGIYVVEAVNCIDCFTTDTVTVIKENCSNTNKNPITPKMSTVYPVPVQSGGRLTIEFDLPEASNDDGLKAVSLKAMVDFPERKEDVSMILYDLTGRVINIPRTYKIVNGKAVIYLDLDYIPSGRYILRAQGPNWSDSKNVIVK